MIVITGDCRNRKMVERFERLGWGRMMVAGVGPRMPFKPYHGEPFGLDNGAYAAHLKDKPFPEQRFYELVGAVSQLDARPYLAVLPDIVGGGAKSLQCSKHHLKNLPHIFPWYLAVQDGMEPQHVNGMDGIAGIFLGGSDRYKKTALAWAIYAHGRGIRFHYGRAGTVKKVRYAKFVKADSLDSAFPLWTKERFATFEAHVNGNVRQGEMFA